MIDAVITWVDGSDPGHRARRAAHGDAAAHPDARAATRFASSGELRFAVLSLLRFCPFVRVIHIVTDGQHPAPLDPLLGGRDADRLRIVHHDEIFGAHSDLLPVFSSRSIETMIHRIPGLADRFLYLNDDIFIGRPMREADYFDRGRPILRGTMRRFPNPWVARIKAMLRPERPGYGAAQRAAARLVGRTGSYLLAEHQPQPMCRDTLRSYYASDPAALRAQAGHRFRSADQVSPIGLSTHLELAAGASVAAPLDVGYIRPGRPSGARLAQVMADLQADRFASFCVQSLDAMPESDRALVISGLGQRYG